MFPKIKVLPEASLQRVPSVCINETAVTPFQPEIQYRGFTTRPTAGVPQGLAVYQNGVRGNAPSATSSTGTLSRNMRSAPPRPSEPGGSRETGFAIDAFHRERGLEKQVWSSRND